MCGIIGFLSADARFTQASEVFTQLLYMDQLRGWDSTGVFMVPRQGTPWLFKRALMASDFINNRFYEKHLYPALGQSVLAIGHNRAATRGSVCDYHAHPFQVGDFTVVHNGHISNANMLLPGSETVPVDSMVIPRMFHEKGEIPGLECLQGGYALAWHNAADKTFNLARNDERPMSFCYIDGMNALVFGSEQLMLLAVLERNKLKVEDKFFTLTPGQLHKFNIANPREQYQKFPFALPQAGTGRTGATNGPWRDLRNDSPKHTGSSPSSSIPTDSTGLSQFFAKKTLLYAVEVDELPPKIRSQQCWTFGDKKIWKAAKIAQKVGSFLGQEVSIVLDSFDPYTKNQVRGRITGHRKFKASGDTDSRVEILNVTENEFKEWSSLVDVYVKIIGAKEDGASIVLTAIKVDKISRATYPGFNGARLDESQWLADVTHGCAGCAEIILKKDADKTLWVGQKSPICVSCQKDHGIMSGLGLMSPSDDDEVLPH